MAGGYAIKVGSPMIQIGDTLEDAEDHIRREILPKMKEGDTPVELVKFVVVETYERRNKDFSVMTPGGTMDRGLCYYCAVRGCTGTDEHL